MTTCRTCDTTRCPATHSRRSFLNKTACATFVTAATQMGWLDLASRLFAQAPKVAGQPVIRVVFVRPQVTPEVSWPGGNCDVKAQQALFTQTLRDAAKRYDARLEVQEQPLEKPEQVSALLARLKSSPPDGLVVCAMELLMWGLVNDIVKQRGDVPTIVYSNLTGFTQQLQIGRDTPRVYVGATQDAGWLATATSLLSALWRMKRTRILFVAGKETRDQVIDGLGTVYHWIPKAAFAEEFKRVAVTEEVRSLAKFYSRRARKIVEPSAADILESAKNYAVCRRLMEREGCHGIAIDCLGWKNPVCVAYSRLRDEGIVAACEQDPNATIGMLMTHLLLQRPTFQQDPSPNTVNNTLIGAHCTSPLRLEGFDAAYQAPFLLRNYHTRTGVAPQVLWPVGKPVTVLQANVRPLSMMLATGRVVSNIDQPPSGCCRTAVEISLDNVDDTRDVKGFHQLFILGNFERTFKAFAQLADIPVAPMAG